MAGSATLVVRNADVHTGVTLYFLVQVSVAAIDAEAIKRLATDRLMVARYFFFSSRRRHTRFDCDWSSDVCSSDLRTRPRQLRPTASARRAPDSTRNRWLAGRYGCDSRISPRDFTLRQVSVRPSVEIGRASCRERV